MYELGYTPNNLRALLEKHGLTQQSLADMTATTLNGAQRWLKPVSNRHHRPMSHRQWLALLDTLGEDLGGDDD